MDECLADLCAVAHRLGASVAVGGGGGGASSLQVAKQLDLLVAELLGLRDAVPPHVPKETQQQHPLHGEEEGMVRGGEPVGVVNEECEYAKLWAWLLFHQAREQRQGDADAQLLDLSLIHI